MSIQPNINGTSVKINVNLLPIRSIKYPPNMHPIGVLAELKLAEI